MRKMKELQENEYIYKVPLMKITKLGTKTIGDIIVIGEEPEDDRKVESVRKVRNLNVADLVNFPIHTLDFSCYLKHPIEPLMYPSTDTIIMRHPCLYELQYVNGVTLYPELQMDDKVIYAVDRNDLDEHHYATLDDINDFIDSLTESPLQKELDSLKEPEMTKALKKA